MPILRIEQRNDPETAVMKYVLTRIGSNIIPKSAIQIGSNRYKVPVEIVHYTKVNLRHSKTNIEAPKYYSYLFDYEKPFIVEWDEESHKYEVVTAANPRAHEIDRYILEQKRELFKRVEEIILESAKYHWAEIPQILTFMAPLHKIFMNLVQFDQIDASDIEEAQWGKYVDFLLKHKYIKPKETSGPISYVGENIITGIMETFEEDPLVRNIEIPKKLVSFIYSKHYDELINDFKLFYLKGPLLLAWTYYLDAVYSEEPIMMTYDELQKKYFAHISGYPDVRRKFSFRELIMYLGLAGIIESDKSYIWGKQYLLDDIRKNIGNNIILAEEIKM